MLLRISPDTTVEDITISTVTTGEAVIRWQERTRCSVGNRADADLQPLRTSATYRSAAGTSDRG